MANAIYEGACFCGTVKFTVSGEPAAAGYCHCDDCRTWSAGPVNAFTLWKPEAVKVTQGREMIGSFNKTPRSLRKWCKNCGGHVFTEHPHWN
ncbi:MAG: GFA family protein, partial [Clostridia bacterium]